MKGAVTSLELICCLLALLAAFILIFINKEQRHSNKLLAIFLLTLSLLLINEVILYAGWYVEYPRLHKIVTPFSLLVYPLAYLYIRSVIFGELKFRKRDFLLSVPAILYAINLMPYYFAPIAEKKAHVLAIFNDERLIAEYNEGLFPSYVFNFVRVGWSLLFISLSFRQIIRFKQKSDKEIVNNNKAIIKWLTIFNGLLTGLVIAGLYLAIVAPIRRTNSIILDLALGLTVLFICIQLFIRPKLLYGIFQPIPNDDLKEEPITINNGSTLGVLMAETEETFHESKSETKVIDESVMGPGESHRYKIIIEELFLHKRTFLDPDYSLEKLVRDSGIPRYLVSAFINRQYGMGFREFLNGYRINYFKENSRNPEWENLTLEAIAVLCGFSNRNTFIKNFKEISGETPSEFLRRND